MTATVSPAFCIVIVVLVYPGAARPRHIFQILGSLAVLKTAKETANSMDGRSADPGGTREVEVGLEKGDRFPEKNPCGGVKDQHGLG